MPLAKTKERSAPSPSGASYDGDFYTWTQEQGALLRAGRLDAIDRENIAEEIESLGRNEFDKLVSFYALIMLHMLKWEHQPNLRSRSWAISIDRHRDHAAEVLEANPGLKPRLDEAARLATGEPGVMPLPKPACERRPLPSPAPSLSTRC
jgi:hypothetical protein